MFLGAKRPPTVTRKVTVTVKKEEKKPQPTQSRPASSTKNGTQLLKRTTTKVASRQNYEVRRTASPASSVASASKSLRPDGLAAERKVLKRKLGSPAVQYFSSSDESEDDGEDVLSRKRMRSTSETDDQVQDTRTPFHIDEIKAEGDKVFPVVQSADLVSRYPKDFRPHFVVEGDAPYIKLCLPSKYSPESYSLVSPREQHGHEPIHDVAMAIKAAAKYYLPGGDSEKDTFDPALDENPSYKYFEHRLSSAYKNGMTDRFLELVQLYNKSMRQAIDNGTVMKNVEDENVVELDLVECVLNQIYGRVVASGVHLLSRYENGTSNVYGELQPVFSDKIFKETKLKSDHVFVDLGSGVGNVVLQAALQIGCESWGIEMMPHPAEFARQQLAEFKARCKRWSIKPGKANVVEGSFLSSPEIDAVLRRADVILINNQAFEPELNDKILMKLLDVREGTRIVSLKSFVPASWEIKKRNVEDPRNMLTVVKKEYYERYVSWSNAGGTYYMATKDLKPLLRFQKKHNLA